jgi:hypothetical protein
MVKPPSGATPSALGQANARQLGGSHAGSCPIGGDTDRDREHWCDLDVDERRDIVA